MPSALTYPGVYIEEIPSGVRTITGVATSITAFVGRARRGEVNKPIRIESFSDYIRTHGGLWEDSTMSYAVQQFFLNDGVDAIIVRVANGGLASQIQMQAEGGGFFTLVAASIGTWGNGLAAEADYNTKTPLDPQEFNLTITETEPGATQPRSIETFRNLSIAAGSPRFVTDVLRTQSQLVRVQGAVGNRPQDAIVTGNDGLGDNGLTVLDGDLQAGILALDQVDIFNLLCVPPIDRLTDISVGTRNAAALYCGQRRAMFIADAPSDWTTVALAVAGMANIANFMTPDDNAAAYFPRVRFADPLKNSRLEEFAPCGMIAGIYARTDGKRGVWKAPAGVDDGPMRGVRELVVKMTDGENGQLNPLGLNCLRTFPIYGPVVWGARTMLGADAQASEWKYIPVRRLALYIEESLFRGTQWVVFEPNDEPLWSQIRLNLGAFMHDLFRKGAFQGQSPRDAYFVKCDKETTTQNDIDHGIVNIVVGFAPLKPAEFVVIQIQQMAGQIAV